MEQSKQNQKLDFSSVTENHIEDWKLAFGRYNIFQCDITLDKTTVPKQGGKDGELEVKAVVSSFVIRKPSRATVDATAEYGKAGEITKANKVLINNCVLAGDMEIIEQDGTAYAALLGEIRNTMLQNEIATKKL